MRPAWQGKPRPYGYSAIMRRCRSTARIRMRATPWRRLRGRAARGNAIARALLSQSRQARTSSCWNLSQPGAPGPCYGKRLWWPWNDVMNESAGRLPMLPEGLRSDVAQYLNPLKEQLGPDLISVLVFGSRGARRGPRRKRSRPVDCRERTATQPVGETQDLLSPGA